MNSRKLLRLTALTCVVVVSCLVIGFHRLKMKSVSRSQTRSIQENREIESGDTQSAVGTDFTWIVIAKQNGNCNSCELILGISLKSSEPEAMRTVELCAYDLVESRKSLHVLDDKTFDKIKESVLLWVRHRKQQDATTIQDGIQIVLMIGNVRSPIVFQDDFGIDGQSKSNDGILMLIKTLTEIINAH